MKRSYILSLFAALGIIVAVAVILENNRPIPDRPLVIQPSISPYASSIAGTGIIESVKGNIAIGTPISGIITELYVDVGDHVNAGTPLFKIDDREFQAQLVTAIAKVNLARTSLNKPKHRLGYLENLNQRDPGVVSKRDLSDLRDELAQSRASLKLAEAEVEQIKMDIRRCTVHAPRAGQVLQLHTRLGEYVEGSQTGAPVLLFGGNSKLQVRVDIDETESWRFKSGSDAVASIRGVPDIKIPLNFDYVEPYIIPKTSLTGQSTERTDTRVLQVIYSFEQDDLPVYVGQQLDVFIQTEAAQSGSSTKEN